MSFRSPREKGGKVIHRKKEKRGSNAHADGSRNNGTRKGEKMCGWGETKKKKQRKNERHKPRDATEEPQARPLVGQAITSLVVPAPNAESVGTPIGNRVDAHTGYSEELEHNGDDPHTIALESQPPQQSGRSSPLRSAQHQRTRCYRSWATGTLADPRWQSCLEAGG